MDMSNFRPETHVAQQSRRDKLRIQQSSTSVHHLEDFPNNLEQSSVHLGLNPDLVQVRNVRNANLLYDPTLISSEMINFSTNSNVLSAQRDAMPHLEIGAAQPIRSIQSGDASFGNLPHSISSNFNASSRATGDPQGCGNWKSLDSQQSGDWMINFASAPSTGRGSNQNPTFAGEVLSNNVRVSNIATSTRYMKPKYNGYQDVQSTTLTNPSSEISSQDSQKQYGDIHFTSSPLYQNTLQDVTTASIGTQRLEIASLVQQNIRETGRGTWADAGNELVLLPMYGNQSNALHFDSSSALMNRPVENCRQWSGELAFMSRKSDEELRNVATDASTQGLSLSLSSDPRSKLHLAQFGEGYESQDLPSRTGAFNEPQDSITMRPNYVCSIPKPSITNKGWGKSVHDIVGTSTNAHRNTGPLGPFTGYATILKSSRFLRPAQELLDEFCSMTGSKLVKTCDVPERVSREVSASPSADAVNGVDTEVGAKVNDNSGVSSSTYHSSNEISNDCGVGSSSGESQKPEHLQKKAKLLYLQEEVCRKYKQYHQQMQMVVSSFESVAGLSAATPYVSLALKTVSKNFRCLKNAISDQLKHITKALGEDLLSPTTGASSSKGDASLSRLKYMDQSYQKHKSGGGNVGFLEPQQHVWRPQRGLPERSVAILRAWLFEHFLHPYPTDTDKHMLAAQTGLSRNQVSNWFINARVRVWKPMVEEIHMLETRGSTEANQNSSKNDGISTAEGTSRPNADQPMNKFGINAMSDKQLEYSGMSTLVGIGDGLGVEQWNQEKRSRVECQVQATMDRSLMGFVPYQRSGLEIGGLGAVSLTLGLRHGVESAQQQQQQFQQQEDQLRRQFGGPMVHDFVG